MEGFFLDLSIVLVGSAFLATIAVVAKQPIFLAYILCGILLGPWGIGWIKNVEFLEIISHLGITFLLFLAGLYLHPQKLLKLFKSAAFVTFVNSVVSLLAGFGVAHVFGFSLLDSFCIGLAMMFSSTILVVKLLPTTELHHKRIGALCIGVLILQDLAAVGVLAFIRCLSEPDTAIMSFSVLSAKVVLFVAALFAFEYYILRRVMARVDKLHEALFVLGLAWCFGVAAISHHMGLFHETGAFFSGVVLARHRISRFISNELKPLRDFFLVLFFFTLGARMDLAILKDLIGIALILTAFFVYVRPLIFKRVLMWSGEGKNFSTEVGIRLGQLSEFALLIALLALELEHVSHEAAQLIQLVTILTFAASSYRVFYKYPTPIGLTGQLMKD